MNNLKIWLDQERGRSTALARHLNVQVTFIHKLAMGQKPIPVRHAAAIESFTNRAVTRQEMFPDDCSYIWPELKNQPEPLDSQAVGAIAAEAA